MADIVLDRVTKTYSDGYTAVKDLNLEIADGEFMILVGPSGCGKSTALNMIAGLEDISSGELRIGGEVVNKKAPRDRDIAMVFQSYALYPHMTVRDNIAFALKLAKRPQSEIDSKVNEAADILDLQNHLDRKPANLSGGQRQRVAMGRAIVRNPKAFLMDEPLSNLDAKLRVQMRAEVARIQHRLNTTTVYVTHDQTEAMTLGDRVAIMLHGVLQQVASPMELYNNPKNLFVAGFIGSPGMNFLPATIDNGVAKLPMVDIKLPQDVAERIGRVDAGKNLVAGIRPEDFEDARHVGVDQRERGTTFKTKFDLVEAMGAEYYVHFPAGDSTVESAQVDDLLADAGGVAELSDQGAVVVARLDAESRVKVGEETEVWVDATKLHFFDADTGEALSSR
ncbi:sn-glycerol-3-phosphate ABC transporter ATP-binding protein UgpC [Solirubrobacter sp. CPCC 204708]|uniref:Sn-glycerol-3-phosphate ABC transporter ATP-binding protein UgpC n=1 Tax=Solirubrobacter deserti TaxID=2282478 RepID=A0ABT4RV30_9ACTN|nr:sn-glycerol-3-phosphate ABC transporter ATP-binding protein UgpC [Solirubrobacter deserti]MBE2316349.1 sn-glycerol-3-phosphate ABC transporter ATP-binding protein UgpC [Solirubrobacter deserti]MDA0142120.1 sn-glycerol-3-phosphate ABC transporter ATP-binding protein UgpC [Solirubrobacter deserti]